MDSSFELRETRSNFQTSNHEAGQQNKESIMSLLLFGRKGVKGTKHPSWKPSALRTWVLIGAILICWALIIVLQLLLNRSNRDGGIIFAPKVSAIPLTHSFLYRYLPTVVAIIYSIFWSWIDLETKRLEPYYQLSKPEGALGKDSLLLHYPFDFIPLVPVKAFRSRHWPVFWASTAVVLVTWGLVPAQASIFGTNKVSRTFPTSFALSTSFLPASQQESSLTLRYAQSVYGIIWLNETLPAYMSRNYTLAPFKALGNDADTRSSGTWTATTQLYSLDLQCEEATQTTTDTFPIYNSSNGCSWSLGLNGNATIGDNESSLNSSFLVTKAFSGTYVGYWNDIGFADYSLGGSCPAEANHIFYAAFTRNKEKKADPPNNMTAIFCQPFYYSRDINATVDISSRSPRDIVPLGPKRQLDPEMFNTTVFESQLNSGMGKRGVRGALPIKNMPSYVERLESTNMSMMSGSAAIHPMATQAVAAGNRPLADYLDPKILGESYETAYRLLFVRAMADVLDGNFSSTKQTFGQRELTSQAVILVPVFTISVQVLLGLVSISALALLYLSVTRDRKLRSDPSTIASVMSLVADNQPLLENFENLDCCTMEGIEETLQHKRFELVSDDVRTGIAEISLGAPTVDGDNLPARQDSQKDIAKPVRPVEFRLLMAVPFVGLHVVLAVILGVLFIKSQPNGLPLPSENKIVQQLLENYIPTAIATLIEPIWILINRLLCMLQPLSELRLGKPHATKSIDLDYSSLPPQLVIFKALRSRHFVLAAVCSMALLANILAIAFSDLFNQYTKYVSSAMTFNPPFEAKFVSINGSIGPLGERTFGSFEASGAYNGGKGDEQFLIAESNYTRWTPLPAWTDEKMMYLPFMTSRSMEKIDGVHYKARTKAFGAKLECTPLGSGINYTADLWTNENNQTYTNFTTTMDTGSSGSVICRGSAQICAGTVSLGWIRNPDGSCRTVQNRTLDASNSFFVGCRPKFVTGEVDVVVDAEGQLQHGVQPFNVATDLEGDKLNQYFSNDPVNIIAQSNRYLFRSDGAIWHNDTFSSDFMNHFIIQARNSIRLVDPNKFSPSFDDVEGPLSEVYSKLFAIWLGTNKEKLLVPFTKVNAPSTSGWMIKPSERLFLSTPMLAISEGILCTYAIVAVMVYIRRPGKYLARLPTSIAAIIALFAASAAVQDMRGTSQISKKERAKHLEKLGLRYGYGSYIGADGRVHIGVEKFPFVRTTRLPTWLERKAKTFWKGTDL
ncbi:hypothetical protein K469DRAFT_730476 [Zopfia rhizophila CBS 207.26]|uniref:Uncharacterized protein n=1 Tax=Zopfia rhizophila CBS 207.26 TaxID=1314779 RepID=A0A6A6DN90_9PEZI|nr:hypothetical protein K469DRAFT_730476 [Zopfia rhizophila CBS 207.26]